jgi:hypothetical protein
MATVLDCARLAQAVYDTNPTVSGWTRFAFHQAGYLQYNAFQGAAFRRDQDVVFAFKGTSPMSRSVVGDLVADLKLGVGMNTVQFDAANSFVGDTLLPEGVRVFLCGHSLGGAIAQIVGNRRRLPFVTYNAPGVGVIAGNIDELTDQSVVMAGLRLVGSTASVFRHPIQAIQDAGSLFHRVQGTNVRLSSDIVSLIGIHYGQIATLAYSGDDAHGIGTVVQVLQGNAAGSIGVGDFTRR